MAIYSGFTDLPMKKWWFSIAMLVYQRVISTWLCSSSYQEGSWQCQQRTMTQCFTRCHQLHGREIRDAHWGYHGYITRICVYKILIMIYYIMSICMYAMYTTILIHPNQNTWNPSTTISNGQINAQTKCLGFRVKFRGVWKFRIALVLDSIANSR
mgnify:CR=1 FL=1